MCKARWICTVPHIHCACHGVSLLPFLYTCMHKVILFRPLLFWFSSKRMCCKSDRHGENWDYTQWHVWGELGEELKHDVPLLPVHVTLLHISVPLLLILNIICVNVLICTYFYRFTIIFISSIKECNEIPQAVPLYPISCPTSPWGVPVFFRQVKKYVFHYISLKINGQ